MAGKRYGQGTNKTIAPVPFELVLYRDSVEETHEFTAVPAIDMASVTKLVDQGDLAGKAQAIMRMMARLLINTDGVSASWAPTPLPRPKNAGPTYQVKFRGPDGKLYPLDRAGEFTDPAKGSSRRRWNYLMFEDEGVVVHMETLVEIMEDLVSAAADRPTPALSSTTR